MSKAGSRQASSSFLKRLGDHQVFDDCSEPIATRLAGRGNGVDLRGVVDSHDSSQGEGRDLSSNSRTFSQTFGERRTSVIVAKDSISISASASSPE